MISYCIWWNLLVTIKRRVDVKFGNELISKIKQYKKQVGQLPNTNDWKALKQLGFKDKGDFFVPNYQKLNDTAFELAYLEGFDGPYLLWNSYSKQWKKEMLTHFIETHKDEEVVSLIEQTNLYKERSKLIDSLSSGTHSLIMNVTISDTVKNIYLVKVLDCKSSAKSGLKINFIMILNYTIILNGFMQLV